MAQRAYPSRGAFTLAALPPLARMREGHPNGCPSRLITTRDDDGDDGDDGGDGDAARRGHKHERHDDGDGDDGVRLRPERSWWCHSAPDVDRRLSAAAGRSGSDREDLDNW